MRGLAKTAWLVCGIVLSALLSAVMENIPGFGSPGDYLVHWLYPPHPNLTHDPHEFAEILWVMLGTNFIVCFVVLSVLFVVVSRLLKSGSHRA
jgi:Na+/H+ antiporter NhaD/arsenite permease-like protein